MAMIVCKKCGRAVSDTRETCIHCGARLQEEIAKSEESVVNVENEREKNNENNFHLLPEEKQKELVWEFQQNVPEVAKYAKRLWQANFLAKCMGVLLLLNIVLRFGIVFVMSYVKNPVIYSIVFFDFAIPILLLICFFCISKRRRLNSKKRKITLQKKFEYWLKKEKSITYLPEFFDLQQKQAYEQTNIDYIKL